MRDITLDGRRIGEEHGNPQVGEEYAAGMVNTPLVVVETTETEVRVARVWPLRTVLRLCAFAETVRMSELRKGDRFRMETSDPEDHLFERGAIIYTAASDAMLSEGVWGVQIEENENASGVARYERNVLESAALQDPADPKKVAALLAMRVTPSEAAQLLGAIPCIKGETDELHWIARRMAHQLGEARDIARFIVNEADLASHGSQCGDFDECRCGLKEVEAWAADRLG